MGKNLYVGNLTGNVKKSDLETMCSKFGTVQSAHLITHRDTGRSRGFGFVEMDTDAQVQSAIQGLHDHEHDGRRLTVYEAKPGDDRDGGGQPDGFQRKPLSYRPESVPRVASLSYRNSISVRHRAEPS